jgi:hypothetical protein
MISKETARQIFNCYQQIEAIDKTKAEMLEEIKRVREYEEKNLNSDPIPKNDNGFGKFGKGLQLGVPDFGDCCSSMRIFDISPELGVAVMDEQMVKLKRDLKNLETIARLEMDAKK